MFFRKKVDREKERERREIMFDYNESPPTVLTIPTLLTTSTLLTTQGEHNSTCCVKESSLMIFMSYSSP